MDDADQGMEASAATIRDRVRGQNAVTLNHQQAIYTEKLRPSISRRATEGTHLIFDRYLKIGMDIAILLDQFLHSRQSISAIRVIGIVMHNIGRDECVESIKIPAAPDLKRYS